MAMVAVVVASAAGAAILSSSGSNSDSSTSNSRIVGVLLVVVVVVAMVVMEVVVVFKLVVIVVVRHSLYGKTGMRWHPCPCARAVFACDYTYIVHIVYCNTYVCMCLCMYALENACQSVCK